LKVQKRIFQRTTMMVESPQPLRTTDGKIVERQYQVDIRQIFAKNEFIQCIEDSDTNTKALPTFCVPPGGGKTLNILQAALHRPSGHYFMFFFW